MMDKIPCLIFDLDGTIFNFSHHRGPYEDAKAADDVPYPVVLDILNRYKSTHKIILVSGRDEGRSRIPTIECLTKYDIHWDELFMRDAFDVRSDDIIKTELYNQHIKDKYDVFFVVDDRPKVLRAWKKLGLFTLNVGDGREF